MSTDVWADYQTRAAQAAAPDAPAPWPDPQPLVEKTRCEPYPLDALPDTIRDAVEEVRQFVKAPLPMVASAALAPLSLAAQAYANVQRADKLSGPIGLFLLGIADSGERKTTCEGLFSAGLRKYEQERATLLQSEQRMYKARLAAWEAKKVGLLESIKKLSGKRQDAGLYEDALVELEDTRPEPIRVPRLLRGEETPDNDAAETNGVSKHQHRVSKRRKLRIPRPARPPRHRQQNQQDQQN